MSEAFYQSNLSHNLSEKIAFTQDMTRFQRNDSVLADLHDTLVCQHEFYAKLKKFMAGEMSFIKDEKGKSVTCTI